MTCRHPMDAARPTGSDIKPLIYSKGQRPNPLSKGWEPLQLPCGQCRGCRLEKSRVWGARIAHEAAYLEETHGVYSSFITLTYNEKYLPMHGSLVQTHLSGFFKRLRSRISPRKIRYYASGEYGDKCQLHEIHQCPHCGPIQRPHYHAIVLGYDWPDRYYVGEREGLCVYNSPELESLWTNTETQEPLGYHEIGSCSFESAAYVARYVMKKQTGRKVDEGHYTRYDPWFNTWSEVSPEFAVMSRGRKKPGGIGAGWYEKYKTDLYPADDCPIPGRGVHGVPPRYYDGLYQIDHPIEMEAIKAKRIQNMLNSLETGPSLESRARVQDSKLEKLIRTL